MTSARRRSAPVVKTAVLDNILNKRRFITSKDVDMPKLLPITKRVAKASQQLDKV